MHRLALFVVLVACSHPASVATPAKAAVVIPPMPPIRQGMIAGYSVDTSSEAVAQFIDAGGAMILVAVAQPEDMSRPVKLVSIDARGDWTEIARFPRELVIAASTGTCTSTPMVVCGSGMVFPGDGEQRMHFTSYVLTSVATTDAPMVTAFAGGSGAMDFATEWTFHWDRAGHRFVAEAPRTSEVGRPELNAG